MKRHRESEISPPSEPLGRGGIRHQRVLRSRGPEAVSRRFTKPRQLNAVPTSIRHHQSEGTRDIGVALQIPRFAPSDCVTSTNGLDELSTFGDRSAVSEAEAPSSIELFEPEEADSEDVDVVDALCVTACMAMLTGIMCHGTSTLGSTLGVATTSCAPPIAFATAAYAIELAEQLTEEREVLRANHYALQQQAEAQQVVMREQHLQLQRQQHVMREQHLQLQHQQHTMREQHLQLQHVQRQMQLRRRGPK